jgi:ADP-ribosylglycohydrolase
MTVQNLSNTSRETDRAVGALLGVAIGDAMGMPSQTMTRQQIRQAYGEITGFVAAIPEQRVSHGLSAATITDDTEQTLLLAKLLVEGGGRIDEREWANALLTWERETHARGVNDLLGPSTKRAIEELQRGVPVSETGRNGVTNGAAMRISPIGLSTAPQPVAALVDAVMAASRLTHNTAVAVAGAAAVASVISSGIDGASFEDALPLALSAAREGESRYPAEANEPSVADRIDEALSLAQRQSIDDVVAAIGTSVRAMESVPMAFAVVRLAKGDPWKAALLSANIGDDTDTIGAISCGMAAACLGAKALPVEACRQILEVNALSLEPLVMQLLALRAGHGVAAKVAAS